MKILSFVRGKIEGCIRQDEREAERLEAEADTACKEAQALRKEILNTPGYKHLDEQGNNTPEAERILAAYKKRDDLLDKAHALKKDSEAYRRLLVRVFGDGEVTS